MDKEAYPFIFYNARWYGYFGLLCGVGFIAAAVFGLVNQRSNELVGLFFLLIGGVFAWISWKAITNRTPALQFGRTGIWTPKIGAVQWQDVILEFGRISTGKAGSFDVLRIINRKTARQLDSVVINALSQSVESLQALLRDCKKAKFK